MSLRATDKGARQSRWAGDCFATSNVVVAFDAILPPRNDNFWMFSEQLQLQRLWNTKW